MADVYLALDHAQERNRIIEARQRTQQKRDQMIIGGAAGAIVLSITFLDKIANVPPLVSEWPIITAWVSLLLALMLNFASHFASESAFDARLKAWDDGEYSITNAEKRATGRVTRLGRASEVALIVGIASLAWFAVAQLRG